MKQKMEKKKAVTTGVQKPPPVKKSPNGIGKSGAGSGKHGSHHKKEGAKMGPPYKYVPDTLIDPDTVKSRDKK